MSKTSAILILIFLLKSVSSATEYNLSPSDDYGRIMSRLKPGDIVILEEGVYGNIGLKDRRGTRESPICLKAKEGSEVILEMRSHAYSGSPLKIDNCSYLVVEGLSLRKGLTALSIASSDHIVISDLNIQDVGQAGIHANRTKYLDILNCSISDTGKLNPQWGEGIYIGTGAYTASNPFPNICEYTWIEGNDIFNCANGEGINIKGEVFHVTIRNNKIHEISPGTDSQYNMSALTIEAPSVSIAEEWRLSESRDIWIEYNEIFNVYDGHSNWNNGIMVSGSGVHVLDNKIYNCDEAAIYTNKWMTIGLPIYIHGNEIHNCGREFNARESYIASAPPQPNPNHKQIWHYSSPEVPLEGISVAESIVEMSVGESVQIETSFIPDNSTVMALYFKTPDFESVVVDPWGMITALKGGQATVEVVSVDGEFRESVIVNVVEQLIWGNYIVEEGGNVETGGSLGRINVSNDPWVWSYKLSKFLYTNPELFAEDGAWVYFYGKLPLGGPQ